jgi:hypothetical protein
MVSRQAPQRPPKGLTAQQAERIALGLPPLPDSEALAPAESAKPWTTVERDRLAELRTQGLPSSAIAERLSRTVPENPSPADKERMKVNAKRARLIATSIKKAVVWSIENSGTWTEAGFSMGVSWQTMQRAGSILKVRLRPKAKKQYAATKWYIAGVPADFQKPLDPWSDNAIRKEAS